MRMAGELSVDAPLAAVEEDSSESDCVPVDDLQNNNPEEAEEGTRVSRRRGLGPNGSPEFSENFNETMSGSLEDLVNCFDDKVSHCFKNLDETTEKIAPVQIRSQEEIMQSSEIWWTLTGNFGSILPLDCLDLSRGSKKKKGKLRPSRLPLDPRSEGQLESQLDSSRQSSNSDPLELDREDDGEDTEGDEEDEDAEDLSHGMDLHSALYASFHGNHSLDPPPQTAEQVIEEIDQILMTGSDVTLESSADSLLSPLKSPPPGESSQHEGDAVRNNGLTPADLNELPYTKLLQLHAEMETLVQAYNEALVQELALRDELEFEKELKNTFVSLLMKVQNRKRQYLVDQKKRKEVVKMPLAMTTVIPIRQGDGPPDTATLQALIKILRAVEEESPTVPTLLTEYILNVVCPS